jgi:hypothetical protein
MTDPRITLLDDLTKNIINMLKCDDELAKLHWYQSEEFVPIDTEKNVLNEICGSVELGKERSGDLEHSGHSGGMERIYMIECRVTIWVPPHIRKLDTPTLNEFRQRIKTVWNDAEDGTTDYPENITDYEYKGSEPLTLGVKVHGMEKTISKVLHYEGYIHYIQDGF